MIVKADSSTDILLDEIENIEGLKFINNQNLKHIFLFKTALIIRGIEEAVVQLAKDRKLRGPIHSYVGQEAVAVGLMACALDQDGITSTHRGHGHYVAKGGNITKLIDELHGLPTGCNGGMGGSMHVADLAMKLYGANGIVGGGVPIACGLALANKLDKNDSLIFCFFGDGASNQGVVLESFNIAAYMSLPIVFICENNQFAQSTRLVDVSLTSVAEKARGFGIRSEEADGLNINDMFTKASLLSSYTRERSKPSLIQANTYRFHRHFVSERPKPIDYIDCDLHNSLIAKDPLLLYAQENDIDTKLLDKSLNSIKSLIVNYSKELLSK